MYVVVYYVNLVLVYLLQSRQPFTAEQIVEACGVDVKGNRDLIIKLACHRNVKYDGKHFSYQVILIFFLCIWHLNPVLKFW